jgi:hypothetical protein
MRALLVRPNPKPHHIPLRFILMLFSRLYNILWLLRLWKQILFYVSLPSPPSQLHAHSVLAVADFDHSLPPPSKTGFLGVCMVHIVKNEVLYQTEIQVVYVQGTTCAQLSVV